MVGESPAKTASITLSSGSMRGSWGEVGEVDAARDGDAAAVGRLEAGDDAEQRGFPAAVDADDAQAFAPLHAEGDVAEERPLAVLLRDRLN